MAISFVNKAATQTGAGASPTYTIDPTGGNILWVGITIRSTSSITVAPTFNSVTMTLSGSTVGTSGIKNHLYYLANPSQASANVTFTHSGGDDYAIGGIWFSGASGTGIPDATGVAGPTAIGAGYSQSVTSVADSCFAVMWGDNSSGAALTGGANTTIANQPEVVFTGAFLAYSTAAKTPAGTFTLAFTAASGTAATCMSSFAPSANAGNFFLFFQ